MSNTAILIEHVSKEYRLGVIGSATLRQELQSRAARMRGKEDPNTKLWETELRSGSFLALDDVSCEIQKGEAVGIIGHNGAGKSTLLKLICRVTAPTKGRISYNGRVTSMLEVGTGFHRELTGRENIYMNGAILGMTKKEIDSKFDEIVDFSEVERFIDTPVKRYSSGMYVKLAFSVAAHLDSEIMIMDEVLAVGDIAFQEKCLNKMSDLVDSSGKTILYVSHNMNTVKKLCSRTIVLSKGTVEFEGRTTEAIRHYVKLGSFSAQTQFDLEPVSRKFGRGVDAKIHRLSFPEKQINSFRTGEMIYLRMDLSSQKSFDRCALMFYLYSDEDVKIGVMVSNEFSLKPGHNTVSVAMDSSVIPDGSYSVGLCLLSNTRQRPREKLDEVEKAFTFQIQNERGLAYGASWRTDYFGNVLFPPMNVKPYSD